MGERGGGGGGVRGSKFPSLPIPLYFLFIFTNYYHYFTNIPSIRCTLPGAPEIKVTQKSSLQEHYLI